MHSTAWHSIAQHAQHSANTDSCCVCQAVEWKAWAAVGRLFSAPRSMTTVSHTFKTAYEKLLLPFEEVRTQHAAPFLASPGVALEAVRRSTMLTVCKKLLMLGEMWLVWATPVGPWHGCLDRQDTAIQDFLSLQACFMKAAPAWQCELYCVTILDGC